MSTEHKTKRIALLNRTSPFSTQQSKDSLDIALIAASFEQEVTLVFMDDGIFQLLKEQDGEKINRKGTHKSIEALSFYDIDKVYIDGASLRARNVSPADLVIDTELLTTEQLAALLHQQDIVLNF